MFIFNLNYNFFKYLDIYWIFLAKKFSIFSSLGISFGSLFVWDNVLSKIILLKR